MGTDFSASVIVGIEVSDLIETEKITVKRTKYNEDTGEPYEIKEFFKKAKLFGVELEDPDYVYEAAEELAEKLGLSVESNTDQAELVIGRVVANLSPGEDFDGIKLKELSERFKDVTDIFSKAGVGPDKLNVQMYSLLYVSY